jgi:hypothetical protein
LGGGFRLGLGRRPGVSIRLLLLSLALLKVRLVLGRLRLGCGLGGLRGLRVGVGLYLSLALLKVRLVLGRRLRLGRGLGGLRVGVGLLCLSLALLKVRLVLGRRLRLGRGLGGLRVGVGLLHLSLALLKVRLVLGRLGRGCLLLSLIGCVVGVVGPGSRHQQTNKHQGGDRPAGSHGSELL